MDRAANANKLYRVAKELTKEDGTVRKTYDAYKPLKDIHSRIKLEILDQVSFPHYLTGSIKGQDYKTNATLHCGAKIVISEDVSNFFPATTSALIFDVWHQFFGFSHEVATCLTQLTTLNGELPQGAITSPQLANLVFWRDEPTVHTKLALKGITYSRFVDDVAVSSREYMTAADKTYAIAMIYGIMKKRGYKPKRKKHEITTASARMTVTKLTVNEKPGLARTERSKIRAIVYHFERDVSDGVRNEYTLQEWPKVVGKVALLKRFHPGKAASLTKRLNAVKQIINPKVDDRQRID